MHRTSPHEAKMMHDTPPSVARTGAVVLLSVCAVGGLAFLLAQASRPFAETTWFAAGLVAVASLCVAVFVVALSRPRLDRAPSDARIVADSPSERPAVQVGSPWRSRSFLALLGVTLAAPPHADLRVQSRRSPQPIDPVPQAKSNGAWFRLLMDKDVSWIPGVSEVETYRLKEAGYRQARDIAEADPDEIAAAAGIEEWRVQEMRSFLSLVAIPGLERRSAWLLVRAGIVNFDQFCHADATALAEELDDLDLRLNGADRLFRYSPLVVERWQIVACDLLGRDPPYMRTRSASEGRPLRVPTEAITARGTLKARA